MIAGLRTDPVVRAALHETRATADVETDLARIAWSVLAEPGDGVAGALIAELGAIDALSVACGDLAGDVSASACALAEGRSRWARGLILAV
ncbi:hypothetical protein [Microbacterium hydrocarbonoxydans]|uniref:hypothetical protein n=1 Tax=Microbacterium hydrocarbonoxydans TaxID=273678 RepID=UPI000767A466|nr:hypothetical protein [Microbacterium hydrocarbonoxydans]